MISCMKIKIQGFLLESMYRYSERVMFFNGSIIVLNLWVVQIKQQLLIDSGDQRDVEWGFFVIVLLFIMIEFVILI